MNCNECNEPMTQLDPRPILDPLPARYVDRWRCDVMDCPRQGEVVEDDTWSVGDKVEWVTVVQIGRSIDIRKHDGVIDEIVGHSAMIRIAGKSRRKRMPLRRLTKKVRL